MRLPAIALAAGFCAACGNSDLAPEAASGATAAAPASLANKAWTLVNEDGRPGVMRIFLEPDLLLQTSCWETYRLSNWRWISDRRVSWTEDGREITADIVDLTVAQLALRLHLGSEDKLETYKPSPAPYVCPEMLR